MGSLGLQVRSLGCTRSLGEREKRRLTPPCGARSAFLCLVFLTLNRRRFSRLLDEAGRAPTGAVAAQRCRLLAQDSGTRGLRVRCVSLSVAAHPRPQLRPARGRPARRSASQGQRRDRVQGQQALLAGDGARSARGGAAPTLPCGCPCTGSWPPWRPTPPPSGSLCLASEAWRVAGPRGVAGPESQWVRFPSCWVPPPRSLLLVQPQDKTVLVSLGGKCARTEVRRL